MSTINAINSPTPAIITTVDNTGNLAFQTAGTTAVTYDVNQNATHTGYISAPNTFGFKNRIINGAMVIDQRNAGASGTTNSYTVDRWKFASNLTTKGTWQQNAGSVTPPTGFKNYLGFTSNSAYSVASTDYFAFSQPVEGLNLADLGWGAVGATTVALSFWVRSSLTGTFGGALKNSASDRSYPFTYTISSANTWEQKSVIIAGDTSGTWLTTNGIGIEVILAFGVGSTYSGTAGAWAGTNYVSATGATSVVGTNGATFYITGVQLEKGSTATPFEYRDYGRELIMCQRYFTAINNGTGSSAYGPFGLCRNSLTVCLSSPLPVPMRAIPSATFSVGSGTNVLKQDGGTYAVSSMVSSGLSINQIGFETIIGTSSLNTTGCAGFYGGSFTILASAEL